MAVIEIYPKSSFINGLDINQLNIEIVTNPILGSDFLNLIRKFEADILIYFNFALTVSGKTELDNIVANHIPLTLITETSNAFADAAVFPHKSLTYNSDGTLLQSIQIYADSALTDLQYTKTFNYTGDQLTSVLLIRASDNAQFLQSFTYSGETLIRTTVQKI